MTKRLSKADKFQLQMRAMFWAFDADRRAREALDKSALEHLPKPDRDAAFEAFLRAEKSRDEEFMDAFGMTYRQLHNLAFKPNGRLA